MDTLIEHGDIMILFHRVLDDEERRQVNDVLRRLIKAETIVDAVPGLVEALEEIARHKCRGGMVGACGGADQCASAAEDALAAFKEATK
jgi:hypothetical protein